MKNLHGNTPNIDTTNKKGVPGAVCDHIRLCHLFKEGDEESELRRYAVARGVLDDRGLPSNVVGSNPTSGFHKKTER